LRRVGLVVLTAVGGAIAQTALFMRKTVTPRLLIGTGDAVAS